MARPKKSTTPEIQSVQAEPQSNPTSELAKALVEAIRSTQPPPKVTEFTKPSGGAFAPKKGEVKPRLKRKSYHHGLLLGDPKEASNRLTPEEITLFNQLKPGAYCNGFVQVTRRRDKGIDIDYPLKTAAQRLRLVNEFGIGSFAALLQRCVNEAAQPKQAVIEDSDE